MGFKTRARSSRAAVEFWRAPQTRLHDSSGIWGVAVMNEKTETGEIVHVAAQVDDLGQFLDVICAFDGLMGKIGSVDKRQEISDAIIFVVPVSAVVRRLQ